jgi:uncharacterized membrane protein YgcG
MNHQDMVLDAPPKFSGSGCRVSAEEWLRVISARALARNLDHEDSIKFALAFLERTAALKFDLDAGDAYELKPEARQNWPAWKQLFRTCYGRAATPAEAIADWHAIRQYASERPSEMYTRVRTSVRSFFEAVNGTRPTIGVEPNGPAEGEFHLSTASSTAIAARRVHADGGIDGPLRAALAALLAGDHVRSHAPEGHRLANRTNAQVAADEANLETAVTAIHEVFDAVTQASIHFAYDDLMGSTSRSLILRTLQTGLRVPACQAEAFRCLRDPALPLTTMCKTLDSLQFNAANQSNRQFPPKQGAGAANRQCAVGGGGAAPGAEDGADGDASGPMPDTDGYDDSDPWEKRFAALEAACAIRGNSGRGRGRGRGGARGGRGGRSGGGQQQQQQQQQQRQQPPGMPPRTKFDGDKYCSFCDRNGHDDAGCQSKYKAEHKPAEN